MEPEDPPAPALIHPRPGVAQHLLEVFLHGESVPLLDALLCLHHQAMAINFMSTLAHRNNQLYRLSFCPRMRVTLHTLQFYISSMPEAFPHGLAISGSSHLEICLFVQGPMMLQTHSIPYQPRLCFRNGSLSCQVCDPLSAF